MNIPAIITERQKTHGEFTINADAAQWLKKVIANYSGTKLSSVQAEVLEMICTKIGRILAGDPNFRDHWDDIAGYAKLAADRCQSQ